MKSTKLDILKQAFSYTWKNHRWLLALLVCMGLLLLSDYAGEYSVNEVRKKYWSELFDHYVAIGTFIIAFAAWFGNAKRDWKNKLPKRLSVYFIYNDKIIMQCNDAYLSGETDIRQMGQQIGAQIAADQLSFSVANVVWKEASIVYRPDQSQNSDASFKPDQYPFRHYVVQYNLTTLPGKLNEDTHYLWETPFNNSNKQTADKSNKIPQFSSEIDLSGQYQFDTEQFWHLISTKGYCSNDDFLKDERQAP